MQSKYKWLVVLVLIFFAIIHYVDRSLLSPLISTIMDELGMMTHAFDHFYLPRLHRAGFVAPNVKDLNTSEHAAGGYVMEPEPGIYDDVVVLDFRSLYPTIIRTFKIDPLANLLSYVDSIETLNGYKFSSTKHFLPEFIEHLLDQRTIAKKNKDKQCLQHWKKDSNILNLKKSILLKFLIQD